MAKLISDPLAIAALATALGAAGIILWFLITQPPLDVAAKLVLFLGIAGLPILSAMAGNVAGYGVTQEREFCGTCHVMVPYTDDAGDPNSNSLAAIHGRNPWFGHKNCYTCHSNYGMFGMATTKLSGLRHVWEYYTDYRTATFPEVYGRMHLYQPFDNVACMQCHSTKLKDFMEEPDHKGALLDIRTNKVSCISEGCHGPAHPFSKPQKEDAHE